MRTSKGIGRALAAVAALAVAASVVAPTPGATAWTREPGRLFGADRFDTAVSVSRMSFPQGAPAVVVASGAAFADALVAGPLAALVAGPVLLTPPDVLPEGTIAELTRLHPQAVIVVGGASAVSDAVLAQIALASGVTPTRAAGADRYDTAAAVAARFPAGSPTAFVATGASFPDALAGGAAAAAVKAPLLLVGDQTLPPPTAEAVARLAPTEVVVLGGASVVSDVVLGSLAAPNRTVTRLAGADRYGTAAAVAQARFPLATTSVLVTGTGFPDALAAAPFAGRLSAPVLLVRPDCAPAEAVAYLQVRGWPDLFGVGGSVALSNRALAVVPCDPVPLGEIAPGLRLDRYEVPGPNVVHVLTVDRSQGLEIRATTATGRLASRAPTTGIGRRWNALATINGDFFLPSGEPVHAFATGGRLLKAPGLGESMVALDARGPMGGYVGNADIDMRMDLGGTVLELDTVNDRLPVAGEVALFTLESAKAPVPATPMCTAALTPSASAGLDATGRSAQAYVVGTVRCGLDPIRTPVADLIVAPADGPEGASIAALVEGSTATFSWMLHPDWPGVTDATGANLSLVHEGRVADDVLVGTVDFFRTRAPRTVLGWLADGRTVLVTVDGRQSGYSVGMTPRELADFLIGLGVVEAGNLDGGGSTALAVRGLLVNRPSDSTGERAVGTALVVVPTVRLQP